MDGGGGYARPPEMNPVCVLDEHFDFDEIGENIDIYIYSTGPCSSILKIFSGIW